MMNYHRSASVQVHSSRLIKDIHLNCFQFKITGGSLQDSTDALALAKTDGEGETSTTNVLISRGVQVLLMHF